MTKKVAMFGSARVEPSTDLYQDTRAAARHLVEHGYQVATGGGPGLMEAANKGALDACKEGSVCSLGYSIYLPFEAETNPSVQEDHHHKTFFSRLEEFAECDAFIALPGGYGTLLEILTVVQLLQVDHLSDVPLILVGSEWRIIMEAVESILKDRGYVGKLESGFWTTAKDPLSAAKQLLGR